MKRSPTPRQSVLDLIPSSWLDPLLTGKDAVLGDAPWGCPDIERLLNAVRARLQRAIDAESV